MNDELKYKNVIDSLKNLKKIDAAKDFETTLLRKINQSEEEKPEGFFKRFFQPSRLVPSMALAVTVVILFFVVDLSPDELENPLLLEPRLREDIVMVSNETIITEKEKPVESERKESPQKENIQMNTLPSVKEMQKDELTLQNEIDTVREEDSFSVQGATTSTSTELAQPVKVTNQAEINKSGLDYRQINLNTTEDRAKVQSLKEKLQNSQKKGEKLD